MKRCPQCGTTYATWTKGRITYCRPCWKAYVKSRSARFEHQFAGPAFSGKPYSRKEYP